MKHLIIAACAAAALCAVAEEELKKLTPEDEKVLAKSYARLSPEDKARYNEAADLKYLIEEGGEMNMPGTPSGKILVVNLQKRVPEDGLKKLHEAFQSMMEYDLRFVNKDEDGAVVVRIVDDPKGAEALTVWPDKGRAEVNVAVLAADNPKPAFLAARTRKEVLRAFSCATAGSNYGWALYGKLRGVKDLDDIAAEDFPLDIVMRTNRFLRDAGVRQIVHASYREVLEAGYDVAPTNGYQKAIYEKVKAKRPLTKKVK